MAKEDRVPPALQDLRKQETDLSAEESKLSDQIAKVGRELRKKRKELKALQEAADRTRDNFKGLSKAPIISLPEYWQLKVLLPAHKRVLEALKKDVKNMNERGENLAFRLKVIQKNLNEVRREIASWNKILQFKKRRK